MGSAAQSSQHLAERVPRAQPAAEQGSSAIKADATTPDGAMQQGGETQEKLLRQLHTKLLEMHETMGQRNLEYKKFGAMLAKEKPLQLLHEITGRCLKKQEDGRARNGEGQPAPETPSAVTAQPDEASIPATGQGDQSGLRSNACLTGGHSVAAAPNCSPELVPAKVSGSRPQADPESASVPGGNPTDRHQVRRGDGHEPRLNDEQEATMQHAWAEGDGSPPESKGALKRMLAEKQRSLADRVARADKSCPQSATPQTKRAAAKARRLVRVEEDRARAVQAEQEARLREERASAMAQQLLQEEEEAAQAAQVKKEAKRRKQAQRRAREQAKLQQPKLSPCSPDAPDDGVAAGHTLSASPSTASASAAQASMSAHDQAGMAAAQEHDHVEYSSLQHGFPQPGADDDDIVEPAAASEVPAASRELLTLRVPADTLDMSDTPSATAEPVQHHVEAAHPKDAYEDMSQSKQPMVKGRSEKPAAVAADVAEGGLARFHTGSGMASESSPDLQFPSPSTLSDLHPQAPSATRTPRTPSKRREPVSKESTLRASRLPMVGAGKAQMLSSEPASPARESAGEGPSAAMVSSANAPP